MGEPVQAAAAILPEALQRLWVVLAQFALKKPQILMATQDPAKELSTTVMPVTESIASVTTTPRYISTTAIPEAMSVV